MIMIMRYMLALILTLVNMCAPAYASTKRIVGADIVEGQASAQNLLPGGSTHFEKNIGKWLSFADAASSVPDNLTGGSANTTCTRSATSPLDGEGSMLMTVNSGASRQGEGCSLAFTINTKDKYKVLRGKFEYAISSGTYADDEVSVWVYDVTNAKVIQPAPSYVKNHLLPAETFNFEFQATDSTSYRVGIYVRGTTSAGYVLKMDNYHIVNGDDLGKNYGPSVTGLVAYTPALKGATNGLAYTNVTTTGFWAKTADRASLQINSSFTGAPGTGTGAFKWSLPTGMVIDTSKIAGSYGPKGYAFAVDAGTAFKNAIAIYNGTDISIVSEGATDFWQPTLPHTWASGDIASFTINDLPIVGWSSSQILSSDANTRVVAGQYNRSSTQSVNDSTTTTIIWNNAVKQDGGISINTSTGVVTVPTPGWYDVYGVLEIAQNATGRRQITLKKNGSDAQNLQNINGSAAGAANQMIPFSTSIPLIAGDTIELAYYQTSGGALNAFPNGSAWSTFNVVMRQGPAQIAASETVAARYYTTAGNSISNATLSILDLATKDYDYTGSVTTGASWKFTPGISGLYAISGVLLVASGGGWSSGEGISVGVYKNGSNSSMLCYYVAGSTHSNEIPLPFNTVYVRLLATDYIDIRVYQTSGGAVTLNTTAENNFVNIARIGNY